MNERIKQLAEQAGFYYTDKTGFITPAGCDPAKFAELIVRECAQVCVEVGDANSDIYPEFGNGAYFSANRVKEHFGVEE
jgi:hypothetical protein